MNIELSGEWVLLAVTHRHITGDIESCCILTTTMIIILVMSRWEDMTRLPTTLTPGVVVSIKVRKYTQTFLQTFLVLKLCRIDF